jgi:hypothetical protein
MDLTNIGNVETDAKYQIDQLYNSPEFLHIVHSIKNAGISNSNMNKLIDIFSINKDKFPDVYDIEYIVPQQIKTNKKKRINKKWAKKYGYKMIKRTSKGWELITNTDGIFKFQK